MSTNSMIASSMMDASAGAATLNISASNGELRMPPSGCAATVVVRGSGTLTLGVASAAASSCDVHTCGAHSGLSGLMRKVVCRCTLR